MKTLLLALVAPVALMAGPASAATVLFTSTFESVPGGPAPGTFSTVASADGWTGGASGIELQNRVAGNPAPTGGDIFVELDTSANSSMTRTLTTGGAFSLSYLYSPRPGVGSGSNGIEVLVNGISIAPGVITADGGPDTSWSTVNSSFNAAAGSTLTIRAAGTSDSLGGYIDNISLAAVPEPASWAMMIGGFGLVGGTLRRRRSSPRLAIA